MPKIRLAKSRDSRTRGKAKEPVRPEEVENLLQQFESRYADFADYLLGKGYSTTTVNRYTRDAMRFETWMKKENVPEDEVSYADILHYIQYKRSRVQQRTISTLVNSLKHYFNFLAGDIARENPTSQIIIRGVKRKHLYEILSRKELESLYHEFKIPDKETDPDKNQNWFQTSVLASSRNKIMLGLMIYQGLGTTELKRLTEKDLKLREGKIYVAGTRRSNERELKLESHQILDLMEYSLHTRKELLTLTGKTTDLLFISAGASRNFDNTMQKLMKKLKTQNPKITNAKQIRTSVITHWLKNHNLREVQYMAGHRFVSSTEAYLVNDLDDLQEDITKFHPIG
ncbi:tyrosine-type recombinase/integrase [Halocola ammonii]